MSRAPWNNVLHTAAGHRQAAVGGRINDRRPPPIAVEKVRPFLPIIMNLKWQKLILPYPLSFSATLTPLSSATV